MDALNGGVAGETGPLMNAAAAADVGPFALPTGAAVGVPVLQRYGADRIWTVQAYLKLLFPGS